MQYKWQKAKIIKKEQEYLIGEFIWVKAEAPVRISGWRILDAEGHTEDYLSEVIGFESNIISPSNRDYPYLIFDKDTLELLGEGKDSVPFIDWKDFVRN